MKPMLINFSKGNSIDEHIKNVHDAIIRECHKGIERYQIIINEYEQEGEIEKCQSYRDKIAEYQDIIDNPTKLHHIAMGYIRRYKKTQSKKDNSPLSFQNGAWGTGKLRVPKLKRKTAWKRFYKIFPDQDLQENDFIIGHSPYVWHDSMIKLKHVKPHTRKRKRWKRRRQ